MRAVYYGFYRLLRSLADTEIPADSGDFGLMDRKVVDAINALPERNRFLRGLRAWVGYTQIPLVYEPGLLLAARLVATKSHLALVYAIKQPWDEGILHLVQLKVTF